jgi:hypothetical protein
MSSYIEQVEDLIKFHQKKVAELEITLGVLRELKTEQVPHRKVETIGQTEAGMITLRRVETAQASVVKVVKKGGPRKVDPEDKRRREAMRKEVTSMAADGKVITAALLFKHFGLEDAPKPRKQLVYQVLYDMKVAGDITKEHGTNRYTKAESHGQEQSNGRAEEGTHARAGAEPQHS